jgi:hypothetical protein
VVIFRRGAEHRADAALWRPAGDRNASVPSAALLYSFTTTLLAVFVELSAWATWLNLTAATGFVAGQFF